jgi:hypothetical protein
MGGTSVVSLGHAYQGDLSTIPIDSVAHPNPGPAEARPATDHRALPRSPPPPTGDLRYRRAGRTGPSRLVADNFAEAGGTSTVVRWLSTQ